ncbi:MAG: thioredoxin family protein, partial [Kiritimatiellae bacterium]|nr:thioredoxin family protein [Kiritimatiellia bacterium]
PPSPAPPRRRWPYLLSLLLGGFLLNLTPCVLPLVPVNLALLGAGAGRRSRRGGFALGCAFGLGIALCYGALGLFSAATGRAFGFLHAHVAFHVAFAILFCLLALAMLDAIRLDFSSLRNLLPRRKPRSRAENAAGPSGAFALARAFVAGAGSALLAGACVAPALVGALVVSAELLRTGDSFGAAVPFALGLGMALPWPLLGAGLAVLPKPGAWMKRVKQLFAALFLLAAVHFLLQAVRIAIPTAPPEGEGWISNPAAAAVAADATGRPVLLALTADWCAACRKMERTTLRDPAVREAMAGTIRLRIDCTDVDTPFVRATLEAVGAHGLPFYAILE